MDSFSQIALGAAVGVAVMGRRTPVWKSALAGAVAGTLPDLDVLIDYGDPIRNMVLHRGFSHAPFWLTLFSLPFAAVVARLAGEGERWRRWWLALWLALVTHPLLDAMTVYGTQLALPFSDHPFGVGSVFIIDPAYTLPLVVGVVWALVARRGAVGRGPGAGRAGGSPGGRGLTANAVGLALSTAYLGWSVLAQQHVAGVARASLAAQGVVAERLLVTPAPLNTVLWRVVAIAGDDYLEGFHSLLDDDDRIVFDRHPRGVASGDDVAALPGVRRIAAFSKGFYRLREVDGRVVVTDLRMGQEPNYVFGFAVAERRSDPVALARPEPVGTRPEIGRALDWLWRRMLGERVAPPR